MKMKPEHFEYLKENIVRALWNNINGTFYMLQEYLRGWRHYET